ncbi:MAG: transglutaminase TgpA family protein [Rhodanobacteraceae bacterium]
MNAQVVSTNSTEPLDTRAFDLLCLTVACTLAVHLPHMPAWLGAALAALLLLRWLQRRTRRGHIPGLARFALLIALPLAIVASYHTPFGRAPGTALAIGLLVLKLLESERERDARMTVGFCCFALMSALLFTQTLAMTFLVALALLPALAALRALQADAPQRRVFRLFTPGAGLLLASSPLALLAFVFVPRLSTPLWGAPGADVSRTGVSDRMAPGDMRDLLIDDSPAMRIGFEGAPPPQSARYFRGVVLWYFDGRAWLRGVSGIRNTAPQPVRLRGRLTHYEVTLEPTRRRWLFALDVPVTAPDGAQLGADRTLNRSRPVDETVRYYVTSATNYTLAPRIDPTLEGAALQLPADFDPHATALARSWRARYGNDNAAIVRAALKLFHTGGFAYNLAAPPLGRDSVDDFLFGTRQGYCEHYASAFAFLMRAAGIPARVVAGYYGGYWNDYAHYLLVRQSQAHAWDEIWLEGRGWVRVDPTAVVRRVLFAGTGNIGDGDAAWWLGWSDRLDVVNRLWARGVVGFDALRQSTMFTPFGIPRLEWGELAIGLATGIVVMLGLGLLVALHKPGAPPRDALDAAQRRLQRKLEKHGLQREPQEGPRDFFARCMLALPGSRAELAALARTYLQLRYGHAAPPAEPVRTYSRTVRNFRARRVVK